jgi:NAD(P)-dependent dehydrogenase (short-subunit alcohol dehydrogenase family)
VSAEIADIGVEVMSKVVDVSDREQMSQLADDAYQRFGRVNVLCSNAGIGTGGPLQEIHLENWDWIIGVNLYSVIYGIQFFLKRMMESGEECHIVNTSSMAGLLAGGDACPYNVTKHGVVALSEGLNQQLLFQNSKVGVSVLCPGFINTGILDNSQTLADTKHGLYQLPDEIQKFLEPVTENFQRLLLEGMHPDVVAQMVIDSIRENRLYIITHPDFLQLVETRFNAIRYDALELDKAMRAQGIVVDHKEMKTYTHKDPGFSISYPGDWVIQNPTPMMQFDFMAVSDTVFPSLVVRVLDVPAGGLDESMDVVAKTISESIGMETKVVSRMETSLKDGTPAMEGEIELQLGKANQLMLLVLNTVRGDKLVSVVLRSVKLRYDETMKQRLQDYAYTLTLN